MPRVKSNSAHIVSFGLPYLFMVCGLNEMAKSKQIPPLHCCTTMFCYHMVVYYFNASLNAANYSLWCNFVWFRFSALYSAYSSPISTHWIVKISFDSDRSCMFALYFGAFKALPFPLIHLQRVLLLFYLP